MGIKGLFPFIRENAGKAVVDVKGQDHYNGKILAIDASTCLYQFLVAIRTGTGNDYTNLTNDKGETTSHLAGFMTRTLKLLEAGVKPGEGLIKFKNYKSKLKRQIYKISTSSVTHKIEISNPNSTLSSLRLRRQASCPQVRRISKQKSSQGSSDRGL